jgi:hypothetical protein
VQREWADPPATEFPLLYLMEHFDLDYPPTPQKPKSISEMTLSEEMSFYIRLIEHKFGYYQYHLHHHQPWFRRNNIDPEGEDVWE